MTDLISKLWTDDQGQDIAEYAVMLAVILVIVVGTIRLIGSNANTVFSSAASSSRGRVPASGCGISTGLFTPDIEVHRRLCNV